MDERTVRSDHPGVPPHWHDDYVTQDQVMDKLSRHTLRSVFGALVIVGTIVIWAVRLDADVETNGKAIDRLNREGSLPVQQIKNDFVRLSTQMEGLTSELRETRQAIQRTMR